MFSPRDVVYSGTDLAIVDNFLSDEDYAALKEQAQSCQYSDFLGMDGVTYKRVHHMDSINPKVEAALSNFFDSDLDFLGMGFRLNYAGELPNQAIHSDIGWGKLALVLYMSDGNSGTAFWKHNSTGTVRVDPNTLPIVEKDWERPGAFSQAGYIQSKQNRAAIYSSDLYHSRFPFAAYGDSPETGRLICVAFFSLRSSTDGR